MDHSEQHPRERSMSTLFAFGFSKQADDDGSAQKKPKTTASQSSSTPSATAKNNKKTNQTPSASSKKSTGASSSTAVSSSWQVIEFAQVDASAENQMCEIQLGHDVFPEGVPSDLDSIHQQTKSVTLLIRKGFAELVNHSEKAQFFKKMLRGPGGAGKSTLLLLFAAYAASKLKWIVAYIPNGLAMAEDSPSVAFNWVRAFVKRNPQLGDVEIPGGHSFLDDISLSTLDLNNSIQRFKQIFEILRVITSHKVLVAVDQFNALSCPEKSSLANLVSKFSAFALQSGAFVVAVSSSFRSLSALADGDQMNPNLMLTLEPYSESEFKVCYDRFLATGQLKEEDTLDEVARLTGRVPRLVTLFATREDTRQSWSNRAIDYYRVRIQTVKNKIERAEEEQFFVNFLRFGSTIDGLPDFWKDVGLTVQKTVRRDNVEHVLNMPICPAVMDAARAVMCAELPTLIRSMLEYSAAASVRGHIFEIWVLNRLLTGKAKLPKGHNLCGKWDKGEEAFVQIPAGLTVEYQSVENLAAKKLEENTLLVCREGFPVVDFVLVLGGVIYLIQVSISSYTEHSSKIEHLHLTKKDGQTIWKLLTHGTPAANNSTSGAKSVQYVYITSSSELRKKRFKNGDQHVTLLNKSLLGSCIGDWPFPINKSNQQ